MAEPRVVILRAPGTNCDQETGYAFERANGIVTQMHLFELLKSPQLLSDQQILCIPGGFSFGDDIGAGVIFANRMQIQLRDALLEFLQRDTLILGICNGFQVLLKTGILPDGPKSLSQNQTRVATLTWNDNGVYTARWVRLVNSSKRSVFLNGIETIELPIAHAEGKFCVSDESILLTWEEEQQLALRYTDHSGNMTNEVFPDPINPNGSFANLAGLSDPTGRVLGLMPHPERFINATQHPNWTRMGLSGEGDGMKLFHNAISYFK